MIATSLFTSVKNDETSYSKPNEDYILADDRNMIYIVADGVTREVINGEYPFPSPAAAASKLLVEVMHKNLIELIKKEDPEAALLKGAEIANSEIKKYNDRQFETIDFFESNYAGAVAIVSIIRENLFHFIYLGDCCGFLVKNNTVTQFTDSQTELMRQNKHKLGSGRSHKIFIRRDICNNPGHPYGYGVFTGSENALKFIRYGKIPLIGNEKIVLSTDGIESVYKENLNILTSITDPDELVSMTQEIEKKNPEHRSDDKSAIIIQIHA